MPLKTVVKVGKITNLSDARYCAGMGVDLLGFGVIEGQPNYISPKAFQEMRGWITGPKIVAELYGYKNENLDEIISNYQPDYLELSSSELKYLDSQNSRPLIVSIDNTEELPTFANKATYLLVKPTELEKAINLSTDILVNVNGKTDITETLKNPNIKGVSLQGGSEIRPGLKDFDALAEILESLEEEV